MARLQPQSKKKKRKITKSKKKARRAKHAAKETGRDYELIVQAIYAAILAQEQVTNVQVLQNIKLTGKTIAHQIDVYWKFVQAQVPYETVVQVKKEKGRATQADLLTFRGVLDDLPNQPRGIFVTMAGYQRGALKYALANGIVLLQLTKPEKPKSFELNLFGFGRFEIVPDRLVMKSTMYNPSFSDLVFNIDLEWARQNGLEGALKSYNGSYDLSKIAFENESGVVLTTLREEMQKFVQANAPEASVRTAIFELKFHEPAFVSGLPDQLPVQRLKFRGMSVTVGITKVVTESPFMSAEMTTLMLSNITESTNRYVLVGGDASAPKAVVALKLPKPSNEKG
jgi:hypothetical protein